MKISFFNWLWIHISCFLQGTATFTSAIQLECHIRYQGSGNTTKLNGCGIFTRSEHKIWLSIWKLSCTGQLHFRLDIGRCWSNFKFLQVKMLNKQIKFPAMLSLYRKSSFYFFQMNTYLILDAENSLGCRITSHQCNWKQIQCITLFNQYLEMQETQKQSIKPGTTGIFCSQSISAITIFFRLTFRALGLIQRISL